jgi:catechol 2,3-dioxygenase-like lactoylglutathione lyase family enzyme
VITGAHTIIYATDADAARSFLRDTLGLSNVDGGDSWLIFKSPPAELAVHPTGDAPQHELYLMCDDIDTTVAELEAKGVTFTSEISDQGWGRLTSLDLPGAGSLGLYEPRHPTAYDLP